MSVGWGWGGGMEGRVGSNVRRGGGVGGEGKGWGGRSLSALASVYSYPVIAMFISIYQQGYQQPQIQLKKKNQFV